MNERILTLHQTPGKKGVRISKEKYALIRDQILAVVYAEKSVTFSRLMDVIGENLAGRFDGSIPWYVTTVKLDLEARGEIERVPNVRPQQLRLCKAAI